MSFFKDLKEAFKNAFDPEETCPHCGHYCNGQSVFCTKHPDAPRAKKKEVEKMSTDPEMLIKVKIESNRLKSSHEFFEYIVPEPHNPESVVTRGMITRSDLALGTKGKKYIIESYIVLREI